MTANPEYGESTSSVPGAQGLLKKPFSSRQVLDMVNQVLELRMASTVDR
ncbi:MAG: hypothetical protein AB7F86_07310 [Bdellovibrionales bacterium]